MVELIADNAGPCGTCGLAINHEIHAPPYEGKVLHPVGEYVPRHKWSKAETPLNIEPSENDKRETCAADIVGCLKAWDYTRAEADDILRRSRRLVKNAETWQNPLLGTGVVPRPGKPGGHHG